jgi:hypothetical protein
MRTVVMTDNGIQYIHDFQGLSVKDMPNVGNAGQLGIVDIDWDTKTVWMDQKAEYNFRYFEGVDNFLKNKYEQIS